MRRQVSTLALSLAVERLEQAYTDARDDLAEDQERQCQRWHPQPCDGSGYRGAPVHLAPEQFRDSNSRYILLDALTALVSAQAALAKIAS